ncbi:hypothetical protein HMPREF0454_04262 [Hafnia alvei ATCC 51873]|uniref:Uncharacterized protein n=1 Tax=Hafnia alvei ATCC 51873 TaxID=1002364 RepID=G9YCC9_HAFAL|nr:hypothetical protein HMPREF0454_04262 [Hafnia alvei ATCC 51873]
MLGTSVAILKCKKILPFSCTFTETINNRYLNRRIHNHYQ